MKRLMSIAALALITTTVSSAPVFAQSWGWGSSINHRQAQLQNRINRGIQSGRLTRSEARRMQNRMAEIANLEAQMRMDGRGLSMRERQHLQFRLVQLSNRLNSELNDFERRGLAGRYRGWW